MKRVYESPYHFIDILEGKAESVRDIRLRQLSELRKRVESGGVVYNDVTIKTDEGSLAKIVSTVIALQNGLVQTVDWKGADGWIRGVDLLMMTQIASAVTTHVQAAFSTENIISEEINNASLEELDTFDVQARWDALFKI